MIRILVNNTEVEPEGVDTLTQELFIDDDAHGYIVQVAGSLIFKGDDYDLIRGLYDADYCQDVDVVIQHSDTGGLWDTKIKGIIKLAGVTWDLIQREAEVPITDNSYLARINNNKSIEFTLGPIKDEVLSKNGVDVSSRYVVHENTQLFSPLTERYFEDESNYVKASPPYTAGGGVGDEIDLRPSGRNGMFIYDALNLIIGQMTDDEVEFESTFFSYDLVTPTSSNAEAFGVLMSGAQMRLGSNAINGIISISFEKLFDDLHKLFNVYFSLEEGSSGKPVLRVEDEDYFRQSNSDFYFNKVDAMSEVIDLGQLFSKVVLGCSRQEPGFPTKDVPLSSHTQEEYGLDGVCNVDNTKDLRLTELIINTNSIALTLPPISGFNSSGSVIRKYTTGNTDGGTGGVNQQITDTAADFDVKDVELGFLLQNTVNKDFWTYVTGIIDNDNILIQDIALEVDATGKAKNYEIFKPADFDSYDKETFLIQVDRDTATVDDLYAVKEEVAIAELSYYNPLYFNYLVIERHLGGLAQNIINQISDGNDEFNARTDANRTIASLQLTNYEMYRRVVFQDDFTGPTYFDTNDNYDNTTGIYTVPQAGYYHANTNLEVANNATFDGGLDLTYQAELSHLSQNGDVIETEAEVTIILNSTTYIFSLNKTFHCNAGDQIVVVVKRPFNHTISGTYPLQYIPWSVENIMLVTVADSTFGVDELYNGGGVLTPSDPDEVRLVEHETVGNVDWDEWDNVIANPSKYYHIHYGDGEYKTGYIRSISRGLTDGQITLKIFKKRNAV